MFVSASQYEGFPISILEGMSYGLPMILSNIPPHKEIVGKEGLFFNFDSDYSTFIEQLLIFYQDYDLRKKMVDGSLKRVKYYEMKNTINSYLDVYEEVEKMTQF